MLIGRSSRARRRGLGVMISPFAEDVVPALTETGFDAYKIASGDVTYLGLIGKVVAGQARRDRRPCASQGTDVARSRDR